MVSTTCSTKAVSVIATGSSAPATGAAVGGGLLGGSGVLLASAAPVRAAAVCVRPLSSSACMVAFCAASSASTAAASSTAGAVSSGSTASVAERVQPATASVPANSSAEKNTWGFMGLLPRRPTGRRLAMFDYAINMAKIMRCPGRLCPAGQCAGFPRDGLPQCESQACPATGALPAAAPQPAAAQSAGPGCAAKSPPAPW